MNLVSDERNSGAQLIPEDKEAVQTCEGGQQKNNQGTREVYGSHTNRTADGVICTDLESKPIAILGE